MISGGLISHHCYFKKGQRNSTVFVETVRLELFMCVVGCVLCVLTDSLLRPQRPLGKTSFVAYSLFTYHPVQWMHCLACVSDGKLVSQAVAGTPACHFQRVKRAGAPTWAWRQQAWLRGAGLALSSKPAMYSLGSYSTEEATSPGGGRAVQRLASPRGSLSVEDRLPNTAAFTPSSWDLHCSWLAWCK